VQWHPGQAVQVDPIKPTLKAPGINPLKLKYDKLRQICFNFAFKFNLRRFTLAERAARLLALARVGGRGLHSSTSQLNVSTF
jgi:hypothetical protein